MRAAVPAVLAAGLLLSCGQPATAADSDGDGARRIAVIRDARVPESSALAVSTRSAGLLYTVNDSGNAPVVYVVDRPTGEVVGTATLAGVDAVDPEALTIGADNRLYVADIGDNAGTRDTVALYAIEQPTRGAVTVTPQTYTVRYADGPHDAEALVVNPADSRLTIVTKDLFAGAVYRLPGQLAADEASVARRVAGADLPGLVTDAAALPDDSAVAVRTYTQVVVYDVPGWRRVAATDLPRQRQGESLALSADGSHLLAGTEGLPSPLLEVPIPAAPPPPRPASPKPAQPRVGTEASATSGWPVWAVGGATVLLGGAWLAVRRAQRRRSTT